MEFNLFKRRKKNNVIENILSENDRLINEIGREKLEKLCFSKGIKVEELSLHLLNLLKDNEILFEKLYYVSFSTFRKINDRTLSLEDVPSYQLYLLDLPIFNEIEQRRVNLLKKKFSLKDSEYSCVKSDFFINSIKTYEDVNIIPSFIKDVNIKEVKYSLPISEDNYIDYNSNFNYIFPNSFSVYEDDTIVKFNSDTIIVTNFENFLKLTRDNIELVEQYTFVLNDNFGSIMQLDNVLFKNRHSRKFWGYFENIKLKINHLLYVIDNSNMSLDEKKYCSYFIRNEYYNYQENFSFGYFNYDNISFIIDKITSEIAEDVINEITDKFNSLTTDEKYKDILFPEFDVSIFITNLGDLDSISSYELLRKVNLLSVENKELVLNNDVIKNKLRIGLQKESSNSDLYRYYRDVMNVISPKEFLELYKNEGVNKYFKYRDKREMYKIFVCLCEKDFKQTINIILEDKILFDEFFKTSDYFYSMFSALDFDSLKEIIFRMEKDNFKYRLDFLSSVSSENQIKLLNEDLKDETLLKIIPEFKKESIDYFFQNHVRAKHLYRDFNISSLVSNGIKFNSDIVKNKDFFDKLKSSSFIQFRRNINDVERNNDPTFIEMRLKEYYEKLISSFNSKSNMFREYEDILNNPELINAYYKDDFILSHNLILELKYKLRNSNDKEVSDFLKLETSKKLSELIIDAIFQDNIYNVYLNIMEMIRYNDILDDNDKVLGKDKLDFYKLILNFDNVDNNEKIKIYNNFKNKNYNLIFYEDLRKLKDLSYDKIQDSMFNPMDNSNYLDKEKSVKYGVSIYDLRDKEYTMLVRREARHRDKIHLERNCYSLISDKNSYVFGGSDALGYLYGYNTFEKDKILHVLEQDSYSSSVKEDSSRYVNRIMTPNQIVESSNSYSEIQIVNSRIDSNDVIYEAKKPDFIVVYDEVTEDVVEESKRLNIPVVIIKENTLDKNRDDGVLFNQNKDFYVSSTYYEEQKKGTR